MALLAVLAILAILDVLAVLAVVILLAVLFALGVMAVLAVLSKCKKNTFGIVVSNYLIFFVMTQANPLDPIFVHISKAATYN